MPSYGILDSDTFAVVSNWFQRIYTDILRGDCLDKSRELEERDIKELLIKFSIPAIIGMLVNALYNIVDRIFIGKVVGRDAIAGLAVTFPISTVIMAFGMLVGLGASTLISIKLGEKNRDGAERILGNAVILDTVISLLVSIVGIMFINPVLTLFGASAGTIGYAREYIVIILAGAVVQNIGFGINNVIRAEGNPKIAMRTMIVGAISNIILDALFVLAFGWGIKGAAIATVISETINTCLVMNYFANPGSNSLLKLKKKYFKLNPAHVKEIFAIGLSPFSMQIASSAVVALYNKGLVVYGGDIAISAMGIISSISNMIFMCIFGINQGCQPILGYNYGARRFDRVKSALKYAIFAATCISLIGYLGVMVFPEALASIFCKNDRELIALCAHGIRLDLMFLPVLGYQIVASNYFQAIGKAKTAIFLGLARQVIVLIPLILILPLFFELDGLWLSQSMADIVATVLTSWFLIKDMRKISKEQTV